MSSQAQEATVNENRLAAGAPGSDSEPGRRQRRVRSTDRGPREPRRQAEPDGATKPRVQAARTATQVVRKGGSADRSRDHYGRIRSELKRAGSSIGLRSRGLLAAGTQGHGGGCWGSFLAPTSAPTPSGSRAAPSVESEFSLETASRFCKSIRGSPRNPWRAAPRITTREAPRERSWGEPRHPAYGYARCDRWSDSACHRLRRAR